jgi:hypothetical protein
VQAENSTFLSDNALVPSAKFDGLFNGLRDKQKQNKTSICGQ